MSERAMKRAEQVIATTENAPQAFPVSRALARKMLDDAKALRAVLKLARAKGHDCATCPVLADARAENRELRRRVRLAARALDCEDRSLALFEARSLLDLRKPLPKRGRR